MKSEKGFTLVELMVVVAIIGILAAVAVPAYSNYVLRGKLTEAFSELSGMRVRLEQFYQDNRNYGATAGTCSVAAGTAVKYFAYTCNWGAGGTDQSYTVTATGIANQGTDGFIYTIDQSNSKTTASVPNGWTTNAACWVTKQDGSC